MGRGGRVAGLSAGVFSIAWLVAVAGAAAQPTAEDKQQAVLKGVIELRFTEDPSLTGRGLKADVERGTAVLSGTVSSPAERAQAEQLARAAGVAEVDNRLVIEEPKPPEKESNPALTAEEREQKRRVRAARAAAEAAAAPPAPAATPEAPPATLEAPPPAAPEPQAIPPAAAPPAQPVPSPFETAPID